MSLRRFPWKSPRLTDNSFKLFVSSPTEGTPPAEVESRGPSEGRSKSAFEMASAAEESRRRSAPSTNVVSRQSSEDGSRKHHHHHHHNHHHHPGTDETDPILPSDNDQSSTAPAPKQDSSSSKQDIIKGPWRLLRLLPRETRTIIGKMLEIQPSHRATLDDMMEDPWIINTPVCNQVEGGRVLRAPGHVHTLEPGNANTQASSHK